MKKNLQLIILAKRLKPVLPVMFAALLPVRAEGGGTIAEPPVQQRAVLCEQVWVSGAGGLRVAWGGEH